MAGEIKWSCFCSMNQSLKARVEGLRKKLISNRLLGKIFGEVRVWSKLRRSRETSGHFHNYLSAFNDHLGLRRGRRLPQHFYL